MADVRAVRDKRMYLVPRDPLNFIDVRKLYANLGVLGCGRPVSRGDDLVGERNDIVLSRLPACRDFSSGSESFA